MAAIACTFSLQSKVRVLSVCVGEYPHDSGWNRLGAANDSESIVSLFPQTLILNDSKATYQAFISELGNLSECSAVGDTVIIHFSGHGQQILTSKSSSEADHVDEAMVPYDAAKRATPSYHGQNHLTDDSFGSYVSAIRKKIGPKGLVIAVIDACHSNSMDKDADTSGDIYRGTDEIFGAESLSQDSISSLRDYYFANDHTPVAKSELLADVIFIGACETHQRNYEIKRNGVQHGSLTYYFCKAYDEKSFSDIDGFLSTLYAEMTNDNTMQFHGQCPSIRTSFGWKSPESEKYVPQDNPTASSVSTDKSWIWIASALGAFIAALVSAFLIRLWKRKK